MSLGLLQYPGLKYEVLYLFIYFFYSYWDMELLVCSEIT